jgi:hypothetical protein
MGTGKRFKDLEYSYIPGPGMYKIRGFSDDILLQAEKLMKNRKYTKNKDEGRINEHIDQMMEMIENESYEERDTNGAMSSHMNTYEDEKVTN